jgi:hypothetical protein
MRQNFRVIHRPNGNVMIVSDGLSDPFDDIHEGGWYHHGGQHEHEEAALWRLQLQQAFALHSQRAEQE